MKVYLVGFMGSGKTTLGGAVARKLGCPFVDLDHYICDQEGFETVGELFAARGEEYFRTCEAKYLRQATEELGDSFVLSTGGGTPVRGGNMDYMRAMGKAVYLQQPPEVLRERLLASKTVRPLVAGKSPDELLDYIRRTLAQREAYYLQANLVVADAGRDAERIVRLLQYEY